MFMTVLVRRLKEGKTYDDFIEAWYPEKGFGFRAGRGPIVGRNLADEREIVAMGLFDLEGEDVEGAMQRIAAQEAVRHDRIEEVIESTTLRGLYEVIDEFDFSTDETVAAGRPEGLDR